MLLLHLSVLSGMVPSGVGAMRSLFQVHMSEVAYHGGKYSCKELKAAVKEHIYPPAIHCAVVYESPPDCSRRTKMIKLKIKGTTKKRIPFPIIVYEVKRKCGHCSVLHNVREM